MATAAPGSLLSRAAVAWAPGLRQEATSPAARRTPSPDVLSARADGARRAATRRSVRTSNDDTMAVTRRDNRAPAAGGRSWDDFPGPGPNPCFSPSVVGQFTAWEREVPRRLSVRRWGDRRASAALSYTCARTWRVSWAHSRPG